jgi:hypothetical protein
MRRKMWVMTRPVRRGRARVAACNAGTFLPGRTRPSASRIAHMKKSSPSVNGTRRSNHEIHEIREKTALHGMSGEERLPRRSGGSEVAPACGVRWPEPALFGKQEPGAAYAHSSEGPSGEPKAVPRGTALHTLREQPTALPTHWATSTRSPRNSVMNEKKTWETTD